MEMASAWSIEQGWGSGDDHSRANQQNGDSSESEPDAFGTLRARILKKVCIISVVMLILSLVSVVVGIMALLTSDSKIPYSICGGVIAGGMAFPLTVCHLFMYCEGKKIKRGNNMTPTFECCMIAMVYWLTCSLCGMAVALGLSGIWGIIECEMAIKKSCTEHTNEKFALSITTLILTGLLLVLSISIMCLYFCSKKAFGFKTKYERQLDVTQGARGEAFREFRSEQRTGRHISDRGVERSREPTAPPANSTERQRDNRPYHDRGHKNIPHSTYIKCNEIGTRHGEQDHGRHPRSQRPPSRLERGHREIPSGTDNEIESPPPKYDDVMSSYLKADDV